LIASPMHSILVVDDELSIRESFSLILEGKYKVHLAASGEAALKTAADQKLDMTYLDIRMPGMDGIEALKRLREIDPDLEIIMVTAVNDVQNASKAIKLGARDYVVKPFDVEHVLKLTEQILSKKAIVSEGSSIQKKIQEKPPALVGQNEKISAIIKNIDKIQPDDQVLIIGAPGTEKETVARLIHDKFEDENAPFGTLNLSPRMSLAKIKKLLFGREKGSTTVDLAAKPGLLEQCKGGTIFINDLDPLPVEIFKILSSGEFERVGGLTKIKIEARLVGAATPNLANRNKEIFEFFSGVLIEVPALKERSSDLPLLINHFLDEYGAQYRKEIKIESAALDALIGYSWPGNTRQLKNVIERLILTSTDNAIGLDDLPLDILLKTTQGAGSGFIAAFEREYIQQVLARSGNNKTQAAAFLEINPTLLEVKI